MKKAWVGDEADVEKEIEIEGITLNLESGG